ncbi:DNA mismatch repair protein MutL [Thermanaeromonas toyohensis ToBE]|uniref:DNA mismatch repair protein MutL n=1 Tax=Thermanaeromonas toyohensis ToBE TaxID=698762 RepID=A0A1W1VWW2_9FIRM|nr:DNA mismatch repair endonuclease MutL [Thermanaeromonas toyohensis]SMB97601.1 DNA mismatch repair protein MutL [Thermanaeromonas toyohensis ToBE]
MSRPRIAILDPETASKIAAGEVVESPSSVVKELIENALDAQAKRIVVEIKEGGKKYIRVQDDGWGMEAEEARLAFARHATSKIRHVEDLFSLKTLGFRGEALPSIAAVARVEMVTRARGLPWGSKIRIEGGHEQGIEEAGCPEGTTVTVTDLFFNTPARRRFLKGPAREAAKVVAVVERLALAHPEVAFQLLVDGRRVLATPGNNDLRSTITAVWGLELGQNLLFVQGQLEGASYQGFLSPPWLHRSSRHYQILIVNGRYIMSKVLTREIEGIYTSLIPTDRYPIFILHLSLPPSWLDVNVHPAKLIIRIKEEEILARNLGQSLRQALDNPQAVAPAVHTNLSTDSSRSRIIADIWQIAEQESLGFYPYKLESQEVQGCKPQEDIIEEHRKEPAETLPPLHLVGQVFNTYILAEGPDGLYIIDQHAAHERIRFQKLKERWSKLERPGQILEPPRILRFNASIALELLSGRSIWEHLGFKIEPFGTNTFLLREVPYGTPPGKEVEVLEELLSKGWSEASPEMEETLLKVIACHGAIKAGQGLSKQEMENLIKELAQSFHPYTCPHGRPAIVKIKAEELDKYFSRSATIGQGGAIIFGKRGG